VVCIVIYVGYEVIKWCMGPDPAPTPPAPEPSPAPDPSPSPSPTPPPTDPTKCKDEEKCKAAKEAVKQLEKGIRSHQKQIDLHYEKIAHPEKYMVKEDPNDPVQRTRAIEDWLKDIHKHMKEIEKKRKMIEELQKDINKYC
jgi:peptidoglycan hydrolase CwlO-like protein